MFRNLSLTLSLVLLLVVASVQTQAEDLTVGELELPDLGWGLQTGKLVITNNTEYIKFVVAQTQVRFTGSYLSPARGMMSVIVVPPMDTTTSSPSLLVPGNYGQAIATIRLYDVVDTLDPIFPGQDFHQDSVSITFEPPDGVKEYLARQVSLPPRVEAHPYFDSELSRLCLVMLSEGKTIEEIAELTGADSVLVNSIAMSMSSTNFLFPADSGWYLNFPLISTDEAISEGKVAEELADSLAARYTTNLDALERVKDSLIADGAMDTDPDVFLNTASVLHRLYPTIGALSLWFDLGNQFITRTAPLLIYDGTDLCNARIQYFMYVTQGGPEVNGTQFYAMFRTESSLKILFGDTQPELDCGAVFIGGHKYEGLPPYQYKPESHPESFVFDTAVVRPALNALVGESDSLLARSYLQLKAIATSYGHKKVSFGHRYWFWNLTATRTLEKLQQSGVVTRPGNGQIKLDLLEM